MPGIGGGQSVGTGEHGGARQDDAQGRHDVAVTVENGTILAYPNFLETLNAIRPLMLTRAVGGTLYLIGWGMLIYIIARTIIGAKGAVMGA